MVSEKEDSGLFVLDYLIELSPSLNETEPIITPTGILRWRSQNRSHDSTNLFLWPPAETSRRIYYITVLQRNLKTWLPSTVSLITPHSLNRALRQFLKAPILAWKKKKQPWFVLLATIKPDEMKKGNDDPKALWEFLIKSICSVWKKIEEMIPLFNFLASFRQ